MPCVWEGNRSGHASRTSVVYPIQLQAHGVGKGDEQLSTPPTLLLEYGTLQHAAGAAATGMRVLLLASVATGAGHDEPVLCEPAQLPVGDRSEADDRAIRTGRSAHVFACCHSH